MSPYGGGWGSAVARAENKRRRARVAGVVLLVLVLVACLAVLQVRTASLAEALRRALVHLEDARSDLEATRADLDQCARDLESAGALIPGPLDLSRRQALTDSLSRCLSRLDDCEDQRRGSPIDLE